RYLASADVCVLPLDNTLNNRARWPNKVADFLACGRATVTNDVGDVGELFKSHDIGMLAQQEDESLARAVIQLLRTPELAVTLGDNARKLMISEWDWDIRGKLVCSLIEH